MSLKPCQNGKIKAYGGKANMFDFYKRQIEDFNRTEAELNALIETISNDDSLSNAEYTELYTIALRKIQTI